jgi:deoxycytidine triphosphate deaminase
MLVDREINQRLTAMPPLATEVPSNDFTRRESKIQAASLDLTIGEVYLPGVEAGKPGSASAPITTEMTLETGQTAVIRTTEALDLGHDLAGIGFPPASLSLKGLLMTNPGHIDPGYRGPLHLTVINMSRVPLPLVAGSRIIRVLLMPLAHHPDAPYDARHPAGAAPAITSQLLGNLSADFVNVQERAQRIADDAVKRAQFWAALIPVVVAIFTVFGTLFTTIWANGLSRPELQKLSERIAVVETKFGQQALEDRVRRLEDATRGQLPALSR